MSSIWGTVGSTNRLYANGISYNSAGSIERMRLGNGKWESAKYNSREQIIEIGLGHSADDRSLLKLEYGYGTNTQNNGSLRTQKISFNGLTNPFEQTYTYDDLNRLLSAEEAVNGSQTWKQTFQYDRYGNRRFNAGQTTTLAQSTNVTNPEISTSTNRLTTGYTYDKAGNLTVDAENRRFVYDAENHQTKLFNSTNNTSSPDAIYQYDGDGRRVRKISSTETVIFVYDGGGKLVAEYATELSETPQVSYLTNDHLGSPRVITNESGQVTNRKDYMAFGEETQTAQRTTALKYENQTETRKGYTGYEKDTESGLDFAQARYYNSSHGRYTSVDPLTASANVKNPQTFNRYSYVLNSPYKYVDPLGLIASSTGANGGWINSGGFTGGCWAQASSCNFGDDDGGWFADPVEQSAQDSHTNEAAETPNSHSTSGSQQKATPPDLPPSPDEEVPEEATARMKYNCLAWALGFTDRWIEPNHIFNKEDKYLGQRGYNITKDRGTPDEQKDYRNMDEVYTMVDIALKVYDAKDNYKGEKISKTSQTPTGYYKFVVFEDPDDYTKTHVMKQDADGTWSSKNGDKARFIGIQDPEKYFKLGPNVKPVYLIRKISKLGKD